MKMVRSNVWNASEMRAANSLDTDSVQTFILIWYDVPIVECLHGIRIQAFGGPSFLTPRTSREVLLGRELAVALVYQYSTINVLLSDIS